MRASSTASELPSDRLLDERFIDFGSENPGVKLDGTDLFTFEIEYFVINGFHCSNPL
jgi:hypothetical protein